MVRELNTSSICFEQFASLKGKVLLRYSCTEVQILIFWEDTKFLAL